MQKSTVNKQAYLIITNKSNAPVLKLYDKIKKATAHLGDVFMLYHSNENGFSNIPGVNAALFSDDILNTLNYKPLGDSLVPGNNHFPVLEFYLKNPGYSYYWCIEDDVAYNDNWGTLFNSVSTNLNYNFISSHIRKYVDFPVWHWWKTFSMPDGNVDQEVLVKSFNPIYRLSNKAISYVDKSLKQGYSGHHEVLLPSLLSMGGFKLADFSSEDNNLTPLLDHCTLSTMRWKPVFFAPGREKNKLYHPVKSKITIKQILVYIKRTLTNRKRYAE